MFGRFLASTALLTGLAGPALAGSETLKLAPNGHFMAAAEINGRSLTVMVDTGASAVALSFEDARRVGLRPAGADFTVPVATANGTVMAARVVVRRIAIGGVRVADVEGLVLPDGALGVSLLGMSFLARLESFKVENGALHLRD